MKQFLVVNKINSQENKQCYTLLNNDFKKCEYSKNNTYTAILHNNSNEIINKECNSKYKQINLDTVNTISISNQEFKDLKKQYNQFNNYCTFSPYHILLENIKQNKLSNSLNIYYYENIIYMIILDNTNKIIYSNHTKISSFLDIKQTNFFNNNNLPILFQEIISLELLEVVQNNLNIFYKQSNSFFIETIQIFTTHIVLQAEQILIDTIQTPINLEDTLLRLTQKELNYHTLSYTEIKNYKRSNYKLPLILFIAIAILWSLYIFYPTNQNTPIKNIVKEIKTNTKNILKLQDHNSINNTAIQRIKNLFIAISSYDMYIENITLSKNSSKILINYLHQDTFIKSTKDNLENIYSNVILSDQHIEDSMYKTTILNTELISNVHNIKVKTKKYQQDNIINPEEMTNIIKNLLPTNTKIKFINIDKKEDTLYSYSVNVSLNNPSELYKLIDKINLQNNPISIDYPIVFKNNGTKLDINFILKYHQSSQSQ
jgi:predicted transcriptional regulator